MSQSSGGKGGLILRIRTQVGTWRVGGVGEKDTIGDILSRVCLEHHAEILPDKTISRDLKGTEIVAMTDTVGGIGFKNGDMLFVSINEGGTSLIHIFSFCFAKCSLVVF